MITGRRFCAFHLFLILENDTYLWYFWSKFDDFSDSEELIHSFMQNNVWFNYATFHLEFSGTDAFQVSKTSLLINRNLVLLQLLIVTRIGCHHRCSSHKYFENQPCTLLVVMVHLSPLVLFKIGWFKIWFEKSLELHFCLLHWVLPSSLS